MTSRAPSSGQRRVVRHRRRRRGGAHPRRRRARALVRVARAPTFARRRVGWASGRSGLRQSARAAAWRRRRRRREAA
jgi:hypothetical protein